MTMPNFLIIGAAKAGTTSIHRYLTQHPQIYMPPRKELNFFAHGGIRPDFRRPGARMTNRGFIANVEAYRALFQGVSEETAIGETSPAYLHSPKAPGLIKHHVPDAKLIAMLRDPVERAYSAYLMRVRQGRESLDFVQAVREGEARVRNNWPPGWHYLGVGFYYTHLKRYFDIFDPAQIRVYLYDEFKTDPVNTLQDILRFLDVDDTFVPDMSIKYNVGGIPKNKAWHVFLTRLRWNARPVLGQFLPTNLRQHLRKYMRALGKMNLVEPRALPTHVRGELIQICRKDILQLQDLIQQDLSKWLE